MIWGENMCGFLCMYNYNQDLTSEVPQFTKMLELLRYRGPDDFNVVNNKHVLLGHCRLSIIDLNGGKQPFKYTFNNVEYTIIYNGEIYNMHTLKKELELHGFSFQTTSDTEVILAGYLLYGTSFFPKLNGIFSFAIWDCWNETLILCRDALGVKPLFFTLRENFLIFSSSCANLFSKDDNFVIIVFVKGGVVGKGISNAFFSHSLERLLSTSNRCSTAL